MISPDEATLLLRGWAEAKAPLRVIVQSPEVTFSASCSVWSAEGKFVSFWVGSELDKNAIAFVLADCRFDFVDVPPEQADLPVGVTVECGLIGVRGPFSISIMLLKL